tara:strand:- start:2623 stop:3645 length:1023 start_codon:yes stop_codon:yes gene_type:complete
MNDFSLSIRNWYRLNKRDLPWRDTSDAYFIWLSEIIMQQTRIQQGASYYLKFISNYPTVQDLANANERDILNDWQGLGYYSRARNLHYSAKTICEKYNGIFPKTYQEIIELKGIGQYTASAISSFAFGEVKAVVDGNVYRLLSRVFDIEIAIDSTSGKKYFQKLADELINNKHPGEHNQAIMELGSLVCKPANPLCDECPLNDTCLAFSKKNIDQRPVKLKKTKVRNRYFHYFIFKQENKILIEQRTAKDIWQNMFQFPLFESDGKSEDHIQQLWQNQSYQSEVITHILSHQKISAVFHHIDSFPKERNEKWMEIGITEVQDHPLPRLIDKYLNEFSEFF